MFREAKGNLWELPADARCITTNGAVRRDGAAVMGRGCAHEAKMKFGGIDIALGAHIKAKGNHCVALITHEIGWHLITFPVKHHWKDKADIKLIERSCQELMAMINVYDWKNVLLPRPGCGNGHLDWETEVKPVIAPLLDERVTVVTFDAPQ